jgi:hypothetical protein
LIQRTIFGHIFLKGTEATAAIIIIRDCYNVTGHGCGLSTVIVSTAQLSLPEWSKWFYPSSSALWLNVSLLSHTPIW